MSKLESLNTRMVTLLCLSTIVCVINILQVSSDPGFWITDTFLEKKLHINSNADLEREQERIKCLQNDNKVSEEKFKMRLQVCRKTKVDITCVMGDNSKNCYKDIEAYKATAKITQDEIKCLIDANTTEWKFVQFVVEAQQLSLSEAGSRSIGGQKVEETQRGKCTLRYTCIGNFIQNVRIHCYAYVYDVNDKATNSSEFKATWVAPKDYDGPIEFGLNVQLSYDEFRVDVNSSRIYIPGE